MKKLNLIYALVLLSAFTSCKKDIKQKISTNTPPVIAAVTDSVSYTIDGKTYTAAGMDINRLSSGSEEADRQVVFPDSTKKYEYSLIGTQDSVMYFQENTILSNSANINIFFLKKFVKKQPGDGVLYFPELNDLLKLFTIGSHPFAEDFEWGNTQDGIALDVSTTNKGYSSYNAYNGINTIVFQPGFQKNSTFGIISFTQATTGGYNLEAKFTAVVVNSATGEQKTLDDGYLRIHFDPLIATD